jgi:N utilization substance protein B
VASRRQSRERALQILYQCDLRGEPVSTESPGMVEADEFAERLAQGVSASLLEIDGRIAGHSEHWRVDRMPVVDRNVLRLAVYEMTSGGTPPAVVIDEALELARRYAGEESVAFVNGVLDAVRREMESAAAATD